MSKSFMLVVDESSVEALSKAVPLLKFVAIEGLTMKERNDFTLVAMPIPKPPETEKPSE